MNALFGFLITLIVLCGAAAMFFIVVDKAAPDPAMNRVAKIAVGVVFAVVLILAIQNVLFGGGAAPTVGNIIGFAIGIIVILVVLYLLDMAIGLIAGFTTPQIAEIVRVIIFAIILIALLILVDNTLMGARYTGSFIHLGDTPSIMKPERR